jgi:Tol biopolymer transport system component
VPNRQQTRSTVDPSGALPREATPSASATVYSGRYVTEEELGHGGMGRVLRARDLKLGRFVALKVLAPGRHDEPHRRRLEQEARAASALNHPNIIAVHDVGEHAGQPYIVTELLEGQTLREVLSDGPLPPAEALDLAAQLADGLAAAHAKGIIHRDLKPENLFLTDSGRLKILDFGIAKLLEPQTPQAHTETGAILGTPRYMSPEQIRGRAADARSDVFAFGTVLHEMLSGKGPFDRGTSTETAYAILHDEPSPLPPSTPQLSADIVSRCLQKEPAARFANAGEVLQQLRSTAALHLRKPRRKTVLATCATVLAVGALAIAYQLLRSRGAESPSFRGAIATQLTDQPGPELFPNLSPDGKSLVYAARATDNWDIFLQRVGGKNAINLTADSSEDDNHPVFSPDGEKIAFQSDRNGGGIYLMGATGESVRRLTDFGYHPAWSPDGKEIVFASSWVARPEARQGMSQLWILDVTTGATRRLEIRGNPDAIQPHWSPHGHRIAYWGFALDKGAQRDIWTVPAKGGEPVAVTDDPAIDWDPIWSSDGRYLYFSSDRGGSMNLWRVPVDEQSGRALGAPESIGAPSPDSSQISLSRDGRQLVYVQRVATRNLQKVSFDGEKTSGEPEWLTRGSRLAVMPEVSPSGKLVSFFTLAPSQEDIFVVAPDGSGLRQLTDDPQRDRAPRWSPDGTQLAFSSSRSGKFEIWTIHRDGSGLHQVTFTPGKPHLVLPVWSPDGTHLAYSVANDTTYVVDLRKSWADQSPQKLPRPGKDEWFSAWSWSADGKRLAGNSVPKSGLSAGVFLYSFESNAYEKVADFGNYPVWLKDGVRLLFCSKEKLYIVDTRTRKVTEVMRSALSARTGEMLGAASISPDQRTLYFSQGNIEADVWMLKAQ